MRKLIFALMLGASALTITACAPTVEKVDYNQKSMLLSLGMSKNDVMQIWAPREGLMLTKSVSAGYTGIKYCTVTL